MFFVSLLLITYTSDIRLQPSTSLANFIYGSVFMVLVSWRLDRSFSPFIALRNRNFNYLLIPIENKIYNATFSQRKLIYASIFLHNSPLPQADKIKRKPRKEGVSKYITFFTYEENLYNWKFNILLFQTIYKNMILPKLRCG